MAEKEAVRTEGPAVPGRPVLAGDQGRGARVRLRPAGAHARRQMVGEGIAEQTEQVFKNLRTILEAAGTSLDRVVKTTVYLASLDDFQEMNEVYRTHVGDVPPARATLEVAGLPSGALVEIDAIALA